MSTLGLYLLLEQNTALIKKLNEQLTEYKQLPPKGFLGGFVKSTIIKALTYAISKNETALNKYFQGVNEDLVKVRDKFDEVIQLKKHNLKA
jgi:hypothetical protein